MHKARRCLASTFEAGLQTIMPTNLLVFQFPYKKLEQLSCR